MATRTVVLLVAILAWAGVAQATLDRSYLFETQIAAHPDPNFGTPDSSGNNVPLKLLGPEGIIADAGGITPHFDRVKKAENVLLCTPFGGGSEPTYSAYSGTGDSVAMWFRADGDVFADDWNGLFRVGGTVADLALANRTNRDSVNPGDEPTNGGYMQSFSFTGGNSWVSTDPDPTLGTPIDPNAPPYVRGDSGFFGQVELDDGDWHHVVRTFSPFDGSGVNPATEIYIDGVLAATGPAEGAFPNGPGLTVGQITAFGSYFKGRIDNVHVYSHELNAAEVWAIYEAETDPAPAVCNPNPTPADDALRSYLFESQAGLTSPDSSGNGATLTLLGPEGLVADAGGVVPHNGRVKKAEGVLQAVPFGGGSDFTYAGYTGTADSVAMWFKSNGPLFATPDDWTGLLGLGNNVGDGDFELTLAKIGEGGAAQNGAYMQSFSFTGGNSWVSTDPTKQGVAGQDVLDDSEWHHVVLTVDSNGGDQTEIYIDGQLAATGPAPGRAARGPGLHIAQSTAFGSYFSGWVDNVHVWGRELSAAEVLALYEAETEDAFPCNEALVPGDTDDDCDVDMVDFARVAASWLNTGF
jgi:hypothetical protein